MALYDSFERSGNWLFRWRSYLPLILFPIVIVTMIGFTYPYESHTLDMAWEGFCLLVSFTGLIVRVMVVGRTPAGTSGRNTGGQVASVLNTTGWYSIVRHPLYVGNYLMWIGVAFFPRNFWLVTVVSLAFWLYYERIMYAEEAYLRQQFGATFEMWAARTPAFIPAVHQWVPSSLPFSWRTVLRREYSGLYGVVASLTVLEVASDVFATGHPQADPMWVGLFMGTTVVYLGLLLLKRRTRLLHVVGR